MFNRTPDELVMDCVHLIERMGLPIGFARPQIIEEFILNRNLSNRKAPHPYDEHLSETHL